MHEEAENRAYELCISELTKGAGNVGYNRAEPQQIDSEPRDKHRLLRELNNTKFLSQPSHQLIR